MEQVCACHVLGVQEVASSNLAGPTKTFQILMVWRLPPKQALESKNGLGWVTSALAGSSCRIKRPDLA
jgi:hypothetical protein